MVAKPAAEKRGRRVEEGACVVGARSMVAKAAAEKGGRRGVEEEEEEESGGGGGGGGEGGMRKGPWTEQEDVQLVWFVSLFGERRWDFLAKVSGLKRTGKSCRLRWVNYLHPGLKRGRITADEERLILQLHAQWGSRWSRIARSLPGRTDNEIKNYWRTHMRKKAQQEKNKIKTAAAAISPSSSPSPSPASSSSSSSCSSSSSSLHKGASTTTSASSVVDTEPMVRHEGGGGGDDADEATTAASQHHQPSQQEHCYFYSMDQLWSWSDIAAAESYAEGWGTGSAVAADEPAAPSMPSPVWEFPADYSLWKIDDEEYYKKMLDAS